jgi:transposase
MAYSMDLRERVARAHAESGSSAEVAETFGCSESWVRRMTQQLRESGSLSPRSTARAQDQRVYDDADEEKIRALIKATPDATLAEVAEAIGKPVSPGTVSRTLKRLDLPRKKSRRTRPSGTAPTS